MLPRAALSAVESALRRQAAVALLGPRQAGKTTLALEIGRSMPSIYLDLEANSDRRKLEDPVSYLEGHSDKLIILDEIHRLPEIFGTLRGIIDRGRRSGKGKGRFLILGSAAIELMRQSESLAGRIEFVDLGPFHLLEIGAQPEDYRGLWVRGGFPDSFLAASDRDSLQLRQSFIRTYLERDVPMFGPRIAAETLERFWTMLAHSQGTLLNASRLASGLSISASTVTNYLGLMVDLLLVRRLPPYHSNLGKRLIKSPKTYVRDSGLLHALLGIGSLEELVGHPVAGLSWEGFVIENLLAVVPERCQASFFRTNAGAEIDLILDMGSRHGTWAIEIKHGLAPRLERGFHHAREDLRPDRCFLVYSGSERFPTKSGAEAISLFELQSLLSSLE